MKVQRAKQRLLYIMSIIIAAYNTDIYADELGRLFTTPDERKILDQMRNLLPTNIALSHSLDKYEIVKTEPDQAKINVNGFVYRKDGKSTVWINTAHTIADSINILQSPTVDNEFDNGDIVIKLTDYGTHIRLYKGMISYLQAGK